MGSVRLSNTSSSKVSSAEIAKYMPLIDREQSCFTDWIDSTFEVHAHQSLILDRIRIEPEFRGRG
jgi:hypothetical protein